MGAPIPKVEPVDNSTAEALLSSLETVAPAERRKHASVFNYWLSIRGDRQFPPIRDLDPLEISDAGPCSVLLEMIGGGEDAVIRHLGQDIKLGLDIEMIGLAPDSSLLARIHAKLPTVASSRQALAFEDSFEIDGTATRCWVTLLPFSASGTWIDYVYGLVSIDYGGADAAGAADQPIEGEDLEALQVPLAPMDGEFEDLPADLAPEPELLSEPEAEAEVEADAGPDPEAVIEPQPEPEPDDAPAPELETKLEPLSEVEPQAVEPELEPLADFEPPIDAAPETQFGAELDPAPELESAPEPATEMESGPESETEPESLAEPEDSTRPAKAGFSSKLLEGLASVSGFYGRVVHAAPGDSSDEPYYEDAAEPLDQSVVEEVKVPAEESIAEDIDEVSEAPAAPAAVLEATEPNCQTEGTLQSKLSDVRAMAEEARQAQLRSNLALNAGLSAAYDFALDAEEQPEEYLRLVEGQGLKIQLRSPMKPVVKLAFAESCDDATIAQLEAILAWALKNDLPRGSLADRIEAEGGIGAILDGLGRAA